MIHIAEQQLEITIRKSLATNSPSDKKGKSLISKINLPAVGLFATGVMRPQPFQNSTEEYEFDKIT